jgi:DNA repair protein RadD
MLRDFQSDLENQIFEAWQQPNVFNIMPVAPTGAGKTVLVSSVIQRYGVPTCGIAHRQELVSQFALALNRDRVPHGVIAPKEVISSIIQLEHETHGYSAYSYRADTRVAGIDTLVNHDKSDRWLSHVGLVVIDEGHHVLRENKWGAGMALFPNARGLFPTAHAVRADGRGLGRGADGLVDALCIGPSGRNLVNRGFLTDYRVLCPSSDIDFSHVPIGSTGDYSMPKLRAATHGSNKIVGDVVRHYLHHAGGKLGITFAVDIEAAKELCAGYRSAGVPAEIITAKTPIAQRARLMRQFRNRELLQLVSVDCLGEGTDVPAIEVVSMVRKTASWQLFCQQFGRALRIMVSDELNAAWGGFTDGERLAHIAASGKPHALIIDHVGNTIFHGLPDVKQEYNLERRESRSRGKNDAIPLRCCPKCTQPYERVLTQCPWCGDIPEPSGRSSPEAVEGDLVLLDFEVLKAIRGEISRLDRPPQFPKDASTEIRGAITRRHRERQSAQNVLRDTMKLWGGWREHVGESIRTAHKRFYLTFGVDVMTAQTLNAADAESLDAKIRAHLAKHNVVELSQ